MLPNHSYGDGFHSWDKTKQGGTSPSTSGSAAGGGTFFTSSVPAGYAERVQSLAAACRSRAKQARGGPTPAKGRQANGEGWATLRLSDRNDISLSLRKTILKLGKQISLMNYLHRLMKHNDVSSETSHRHKKSDSAQVPPDDQRENFNFNNPKGQKHY